MVDSKNIKKIFEFNFWTNGQITVQDDGSIDVDGDVSLNKLCKQLPVQFGNIDGDLYCGANQLQSLTGSPHSISGNFYVHDNQLTSLENGPMRVSSSYICKGNQLTSLNGVAELIGGNLQCELNPLTSLNGIEDIDGGIWLTYNNNLPLLRTLLSKNGVNFRNEFGYTRSIRMILNQFAGQGRRGVLPCTAALLKLEKVLQQDDPTISLRGNIRW